MHLLRSRLILKTLLVAGVLFFSSFSLYRYVFDRNDVIFELLLSSLNDYHYSPVKLDDNFSEKVYDLYLKRLDGSKKFLLKEDVDQLAKYRRDIDDQVLNQRHEFFKKSVELITRRINEKEDWAKEILAQPLDYSVDEEYETDGAKTTFARSQEELRKEWTKMLKYQVLSRIDEALDRQEKAAERKDTAFKAKPFDSIEVDARRKTIKANQDLFKYLKKLNSRDRFAHFANAVAGVYDPHTEYFPPKEKKKFDQAMSGQFEGIGARLQQRDGVLKVSEIIVGSPSYRQGELKAGDEILKVGQGSKEPVDVTNMDMDDAVELIKGKKGSEVRLTVKKTDGTIKVISIIRDVVEIEETFAKSTVLDNKNKIGYIYLPSFYTTFAGNGSRHCSQDVRREIDKLKRQNVKGIIIDLRDNGGGSLQEVIDMAGLFFPKGPVVQVKGRNNMRNVMEDKNPDVAWDGPLAVMINHNSASASEILAAAIQDYKRGIIVGTQSFGKGTVQSFFDLDNRLIPQFDTIKPVGQVKITHQKFYRINGGATQLKGVIPDVVFPDPYAMIDLGEKEMDYPMAWDEIPRADYVSYTGINYPSIVKGSESRIKKSPQFNLIEQQAKEVKAKRDDTRYNLKFEKFRQEVKQYRDQNKKYEDLRQEIKGFSAQLLPEDLSRMANDTAKAGRENRWARNLAKDVYVYEATNILNDLKTGAVIARKGE